MGVILEKWMAEDVDDLPFMWQMIVLAYTRGYRVSDDGAFTSPYGNILNVRRRGKQRYPTFSLTSVDTPSGVYGIPAHKFAAFCFFGREAMIPGAVVRHCPDSNTENNGRANLLLGTGSDNEMDKPSAVRIATAQAGRAAQGVQPLNAKFTPHEADVIRERVRSGPRGTAAAISREYQVTKACISSIVRGVNYVG